MNLLDDGSGGIRRIVSIPKLKKLGGYRELDILTGHLSSKRSYWRAESKDKIIYLNYYANTLSVGIDETDYGAQRDSSIVGGYSLLSDETSNSPTTSEIIDFMKWRIKEDQIIEFLDY